MYIGWAKRKRYRGVDATVAPISDIECWAWPKVELCRRVVGGTLEALIGVKDIKNTQFQPIWV